jgi:Fe-S cluster assembly iron-binding protein IscA
MLLTFGNLYWRQLSSQGGTPRANPSNALFAQDHLCQALPTNLYIDSRAIPFLNDAEVVYLHESLAASIKTT